MEPEWLELARSLARADFNQAEVFIEKSNESWVDEDNQEHDWWRVTVVAMPVNRPVTSDKFPERWLAEARAQDFERLMRTFLRVEVRRRYRAEKRSE